MSKTTFRKALIAAVVCSFLLVTGSPDARPGSIPSGNLVQNPGAEAGPGATTTSQTVAPTGWTTSGGFSSVVYNDKLGFPGAKVATAIGGGTNFFAGGPNTQVGTATQTIDVASAASEIDAGAVTATLSAYLGGFSSHPDAAKVDLEYLDTASKALGALHVGPVTNDDRKNTTDLLQRSASGDVPLGTRQLKVTITATRAVGSYNDGYADNISVQLKAKAAPPPPAAKPVFTAHCAKHKIALAVRSPSGQKISSVTFVAAGKTLATDRKAPFAASFTPKAKHGAIKVSARVLVGGKRIVLARSVSAC